jgi:hypothetical protein
MVPALSTHLHEQSFKLQIIQQAILKGEIFGYGTKAIYLRFAFRRVLGKGILFASFWAYCVLFNEQNVLVLLCLLLREF